MNGPLELPLKDIHLPAQISWWPPAPGWWLVFSLLIILAVAAYLWRLRQQRIRRSAVSMARVELESLQNAYLKHHDARRFIAELSVLLRRLSISAFPRTETASLTGDAWLQFLDTPLEDKAFTSGPGRILVEAPYRPDVDDKELQPLVTVCQKWIDKLGAQK